MKSVEEMKNKEIVEVVRRFLADVVMSLGEIISNHGLVGGFMLHPKAYAAIKKSKLKKFIDVPGVKGEVEHTLGGLPYATDEDMKQAIGLIITPNPVSEKERVD